MLREILDRRAGAKPASHARRAGPGGRPAGGAWWSRGDPRGLRAETVDRDGDQSLQRGLGGETAGPAQRMKAVAHELVGRRVTPYVSDGDRVGDDEADDLAWTRRPGSSAGQKVAGPDCRRGHSPRRWALTIGWAVRED